jgi:hypothetical protein
MVRKTMSKVFLQDPVDSWGASKTVGPSEQSVRTHAPPSVYDRRGDLMYWDDFESSSQRYQDWVTLASGGTVNRSTENPKFGDFGVKLVTGATADDAAVVYYYLNDFHINRVGMEISFASCDTDCYIIIDLNYFDGVTKLQGKIAYDQSNDEFRVWSGGSWSTAATLPMFLGNSGEKLPFTTMKLVMDLDRSEYVRGLCAGSEVDLSAKTPITAADATKRGIIAYVWYQTKAASAQTAYIDDFKFTCNEPE